MAILRTPVLLIVNPGSRRGLRRRAVAQDGFRREGVAADVVLTERPGHAAIIAAESHARYQAIFTLGGDGTVMEVVGALAHTGVPVGVLPGGTGNLIARTLGIPLDVRSAVAALVHGDEAKIDLGSIGAHRFAFAAGVGIDASMVAETPAWLKRRLGVAAYFLTAGRAAVRRQSFGVRATVDGTVHEREAVAVLVANFGAVFHERLTLGPGIRQDDGMLDLCVFSPRAFGESVAIVRRLLRKDFRTDSLMLYAPGRRIHVETTPSRPVQADGDMLGTTPFEAIVEPLAAHLLVPRAR